MEMNENRNLGTKYDKNVLCGNTANEQILQSSEADSNEDWKSSMKSPKIACKPLIY